MSSCLAKEIDYLNLEDESEVAHYLNFLIDYIEDVGKIKNELTSSLLKASVTGFTSVAKIAIKHGAELDAMHNDSDSSNFSPLLMSSANGHFEMVKLLIKNGAKIDLRNSDGASALIVACAEHHEEVAAFLLSKGADPSFVFTDEFGIPHTAEDYAINNGWDWEDMLMKASRDVFHFTDDMLRSAMIKLWEEGGKLVSKNDAMNHARLLRRMENYLNIEKLELNKIKNRTEVIYYELKQKKIDTVDKQAKKKKRNLNVELFNSAIQGDSKLSLIKNIIEEGADVNFVANKQGWSALLAASNKGHIEVVKYLIDNGADVNLKLIVNGWNGVMNAAHYGHIEVAKLLLDHNADIDAVDNTGLSALMIACNNKQEEMASLLLNHSADISLISHDGQSAESLALYKGLNWGKLLLKSPNPIAADYLREMFFDALDHSDFELLKSLVGGININAYDKYGRTALHLASTYHGFFDIVELLIENEADVNLMDAEEESNPILAASYKGYYDVVKLLIDNNADVDVRNHRGQNSVMLASSKGFFDVARLLIENGGEINLIDKSGNNPLMNASYFGHFDVVQLLVEYGADVNIVDLDLESALMQACFNNHQEIASFLLASNADPFLIDSSGGTAESRALQNDWDWAKMLDENIPKKDIDNEYSSLFGFKHRLATPTLDNLTSKIENLTHFDHQQYISQEFVSLNSTNSSSFDTPTAANGEYFESTIQIKVKTEEMSSQSLGVLSVASVIPSYSAVHSLERPFSFSRRNSKCDSLSSSSVFGAFILMLSFLLVSFLYIRVQRNVFENVIKKMKEENEEKISKEKKKIKILISDYEKIIKLYQINELVECKKNQKVVKN